MTEHVTGICRGQFILFPDTLDEYIDEENPVRFIDAFVDSLDLSELGFKRSEPSDMGRPSYDPAYLLKLYVYGYLNQIRSSRKLERECNRNVEVMWLMKKLAPDFKTISDFRKDNIDCIKPVFKEFVYLCKGLDLFGAELLGIDGSRFKAVNSRNRNFNEKTLAERLRRVEEKIAQYLKEMEENDKADEKRKGDNDDTTKVERLKEKISNLEERRQQYIRVQTQMRETGRKEVSLTDPDSRLMRVDNQKLDVCYNIQSAVDAKNHLVADYDVTNSASDYNQLSSIAMGAKETLGVDTIDVTADTGYDDAEEIKKCIENGITPYIPKRPPPNPNKKKTGIPEPDFEENRFVYNEDSDTYTCPAGYLMNFLRWGTNNSGKRMRLYRTAGCNNSCPFRARCTTSKRGRIIYRWEYEAILDEMRARLGTEQGIKKVLIRKEIVEHPFGTMKRAFHQGYLLLKGLRKVKGEVGFTMLAYDMRRAINILGTKALTTCLMQ